MCVCASTLIKWATYGTFIMIKNLLKLNKTSPSSPDQKHKKNWRKKNSFVLKRHPLTDTWKF